MPVVSKGGFQIFEFFNLLLVWNKVKPLKVFIFLPKTFVDNQQQMRHFKNEKLKKFLKVRLGPEEHLIF